MAIQPLIPTYSHAGVPVAATFNLGNHILEVATDQSITLIDSTAYQQSTSFTATEAASLSSDEAYRLLMILQTLFV